MKKEKIYRQNDKECRRYMADIKDIREIEGEEWGRLLADLTHGDSGTVAQARQRLMTGCLPMVARLAARYDYLEEQGVKRIDLIGAGNLALVEVVTRLTDDPGVALEAYLVTCIKKGIQQARDRYLDCRPLYLVTDCDDDDDEDDDWDGDADAGRAAAAATPTGRCRSLDDTLDEDSETTLADTIDDGAEADAEPIRASARAELQRLLRSWFCYEEAGILYDTLLSECPVSMKQCVKKYDLTLRQVRGIRQSAINRLRLDERRHRVAELLREAR